MKNANTKQDHYRVLGLSGSSHLRSKLSYQDIKAAYRTALLRYHPDKTASVPSTLQLDHTIDEIVGAYKVLGNSATRKIYDETYRNESTSEKPTKERPLTGLDTIDLDDLEFDDVESKWFRSCRCGLRRGYLISEEDLEREADHGEIAMGCKGCSLHILVTFAIDSG